MSANIDSMMYTTGMKPWHGIGQEVSGAATAEEAINAAHLFWQVTKEPVFFRQGDSEFAIPDRFATVRSDTKAPLGIVGHSYTPLQNSEAFSFFDSVVGSKQAKYHVAGALGDGETVWILAKLPTDMRVAKDDIIKKYLLFVNKHDGTGSVRMFFTPIRVVCQNTLNAAISGKKAHEGFAVRHVADVQSKVKVAQEMLGLAVEQYARLETVYTELVKIPVDDVWVRDYIAEVFPVPNGAKEPSTRLKNIREKAEGRFASMSNMLPGVRGTAWAAYNAVTEYVDHKRKIPMLQEQTSRRLDSIWLGSGADIKQRAFAKVLDRVSLSWK